MVDKDSTVAPWYEAVRMLGAITVLLNQKIATPEAFLESSRPPSSDIVKEPPPGPADGTERIRSGHPGHQESRLQPFAPQRHFL
jgi:hypothetical protein